MTLDLYQALDLSGCPPCENRVLEAQFDPSSGQLKIIIETRNPSQVWKNKLEEGFSKLFPDLVVVWDWRILEPIESIPFINDPDFEPGEETEEILPADDFQGACLEDILSNFSQADLDRYQQDQREREQAFIQQNPVLPSKPKKPRIPKDNGMLMGRSFREDVTDIADIQDGAMVGLLGRIEALEVRPVGKGKSRVYTFDLEDETGAINCKIFANERTYKKFEDLLANGLWVHIEGQYHYDPYARHQLVTVQTMAETDPAPQRMDRAPEKHIPLHIHTLMTTSDGFISVSKLFERLKLWGVDCIGITDIASVQSFNDAYWQGKKNDIRVIYGLDLRVYDDQLRILTHPGRLASCQPKTYTVLDIETTGLDQAQDRITEIGAVRLINGEIVATYQQLVNPERPIPPKIVEITGISDQMVASAPTMDQAWPEFLDFVGNSVCVAHNADFDMGFIKTQAKRLGSDIRAPYVDTMQLGRALMPDLRNHRLDTLSKALQVPLINHHRASDDATATAKIFIQLLKLLEDKGLDIEDVNRLETTWPVGKNKGYENLIYVQKQEALPGFYKLLTEASTTFLEWDAGIPKSELGKYREGLLIGSGGRNGKLFQALAEEWDEEEIDRIASFYDFFQVEPDELHSTGVREDYQTSLEIFRQTNRKIVALAKDLNKPVIATGDVRYMDPKDNLFREILHTGSDRKKNPEPRSYAPVQYLRTTEEMLEGLSYLGPEEARRVVIEGPRALIDEFDEIRPVPKETYAPIIEGSDTELRSICFETAHEKYGNPLPEIVESRLNRELDSIISNGYSVLYIIARKLVLQSEKDGYLVGSRGSVGSSFAATMAGITEVNPLKPHYYCPNCQYSNFDQDPKYASGFDMPDQACPQCGTRMEKDGQEIPFEVFLGFEGDKEPDIDLNFASEYQPIIHKYTEDYFGQEHVFRAGTIGTVQDNTAFGFIRKYCEALGVQDPNPAEVRRLQRGMIGVKRSAGQHPGGILIVPDYKEVYDFTPIQYASNDKSSVLITHYIYNDLEGVLLKLDELGHDGPTFIRMLTDLTGVDARKVPLDDPATMSIFRSTEALDAKMPYSCMDGGGAIGIPEFGTSFVRGMLRDTLPTTFGELVRISGLSHGTDVWLNNAQTLIQQGTTELSQAICTRDDIMNYLISMGMDKKLSFNIMEQVRKGRILDEETTDKMREASVPEWYIDSCQKIKYMFPKAHAVAYVMVSFRIAYFKVHHPAAFYATYFTVKLQDFPGSSVLQGIYAVQSHMQEIEGQEETATARDKSYYTVLEVAEEMYARGIEIKKPDLYRSKATEFILEDGAILPPLAAVPNVSSAMAQSVVLAREEAEFLSIQDFSSRTQVNKNGLQSLRDMGLMDHLSETNQLSFF